MRVNSEGLILIISWSVGLKGMLLWVSVFSFIWGWGGCSGCKVGD